MSFDWFDLFTQQRRQQIITILEKNQRATVSELSLLFEVSTVTIRKDLAWLANFNPILCVRDQAILISGAIATNGFDLGTREHFEPQRKTLIGITAAMLVKNNETIALDSSPGTLYLARVLGACAYKELTIITNNLRSALELSNRPGISVIMPGGQVGGKYSLISNIEVNETLIKQVHIDRAFVGAKGFSVTEGLTDSNCLEISYKRDIVAGAKEVVALLDHTRWKKIALATFCQAEQIKTIITDMATPRYLIEMVRERGIKVVVI